MRKKRMRTELGNGLSPGRLAQRVIDSSLRDLAPKQGAREERPIEEQCTADGLAAEKRAVHLSVTRNNEEREMLKLGLVKSHSYARSYAMPPGVPRDRVRAVESAF